MLYRVNLSPVYIYSANVEKENSLCIVRAYDIDLEKLTQYSCVLYYSALAESVS